jgi:hypothetical protein
MERPDSKFIGAVSEGWPLVLSNLKSLLETGDVAVVYHHGHGDQPHLHWRAVPVCGKGGFGNHSSASAVQPLGINSTKQLSALTDY